MLRDYSSRLEDQAFELLKSKEAAEFANKMKSELNQDVENPYGEGLYTSQGSQTAFKVTSEYSLFTSSVNPFAINLNNMVEEEEKRSHSETSAALKLDDDSIQDADRDLAGEKLVVSGRLPINKVTYLG